MFHICGLVLAHLQRGKPDHRQNQRDDPETDHDLRLGPTLFLKVMMDRRHQENAFPRAFKIEHLDDNRQRLDNEQTTHNAQDDFMFRGNCDGTKRPTQCQ